MWHVQAIGTLGLVLILGAYWLNPSGRTAAQSAIYRCARSSPTPQELGIRHHFRLVLSARSVLRALSGERFSYLGLAAYRPT